MPPLYFLTSLLDDEITTNLKLYKVRILLLIPQSESQPQLFLFKVNFNVKYLKDGSHHLLKVEIGISGFSFRIMLKMVLFANDSRKSIS